MRNGLSADTAIVHYKGIFGVYLGYYCGVDYYKKKEKSFEQRAMDFFVKLSEVDMVHTETICFISS